VEQGETLRRALKVKVNAGGEGECCLFDCVQATWNVLEPSAGAALLQAHEAGRACQILGAHHVIDTHFDPSFLE